MTIPEMLKALKSHGWACEFPTARHAITDDLKQVHRCVYCIGSLWHFADAAVYLSDAGRVLMTGELYSAFRKDVEFSEFLEWLGMERPVWEREEVKPVAVKERQRGLFDE